ncbi:Transcriptional regulator [Candidatus Burkholderia humilis]|nr:Transcriptional regulator [Candidatus Burkholderia humilis]
MIEGRFAVLTAEIVSAYISKHVVSDAELPDLIRTVFLALRRAASAPEHRTATTEPAVPIRASVKHDYLICLEDGKKMTMLKRYLRTHYDMSPEEYRRKWGLPGNYPMVAQAYVDQRRMIAKKIGLGSKRTSPEKIA